MDCGEVKTQLPFLLDGELEARDCVELESHLAACQDCARLRHQDASLQHTLRGPVRERSACPAPDSLRRRVRGDFTRQRRRATLIRAARVGSVGAFAVGAAVVAFAAIPGPEGEMIEDAVLRHARHLPVEIVPESPESAERWFAGKLDHRVAVPRLRDASLEGARLSNVSHKPAAYLTYEARSGGDARRVGLFVIDDTERELQAEPLPTLGLGTRHGFNVAVWRENEIVYQMVTDLDEQDIRRLLERDEDGAAAVRSTTAPRDAFARDPVISAPPLEGVDPSTIDPSATVEAKQPSATMVGASR